MDTARHPAPPPHVRGRGGRGGVSWHLREAPRGGARPGGGAGRFMFMKNFDKRTVSITESTESKKTLRVVFSLSWARTV